MSRLFATVCPVDVHMPAQLRISLTDVLTLRILFFDLYKLRTPSKTLVRAMNMKQGFEWIER